MTLDPETFSQLRQQVRRFVWDRLVPNEDRVEQEDEVPAELIAEMKSLGLFGLSIPEEYGGLSLIRFRGHLPKGAPQNFGRVLRIAMTPPRG